MMDVSGLSPRVRAARSISESSPPLGLSFSLHGSARAREETDIATGTTSVPYGAPLRGKSPQDRPPRGRTCGEPGCATVLSTYNRSATCFLHTPAVYIHPVRRD